MSVNLAAGGYRVAMREAAIVVSELVKIDGGNEQKHYRAVAGGRQDGGAWNPQVQEALRLHK